MLSQRSIQALSKEEFFARKKINLASFEQVKLSINSDIDQHATWLFKIIYSKPYLKAKENAHEIARFHHGIMHVNRVAFFVSVFANLYRKHNNVDALKLTGNDIKLLQIAALFHDAGRENDGKDLWDNDSALLLYFYLMRIGAPEEKALFFAEVIANKDKHNNVHEKLYITQDSQFYWQKVANVKKNIAEKILHDCDCLDIIRVRDHFNASYLDFYQEHAKHNQIAFYEMSTLIALTRSLLAKQGELPQDNDPDKKLIFESVDGYKRLLLQIVEYSELSKLYHFGTLLPKEILDTASFVNLAPYNPDLGLDLNNIKNALNSGKLFARGIAYASGISIKPITIDDHTKIIATLSQIEIGKAARRKGVATTSSKANKLEKHGNPNRSITMLGPGVITYHDVGGLLIDIKHEQITSVSEKNAYTGYGKKAPFTKLVSQLSNEQKKEALLALHRSINMGGTSLRYEEFVATHNEITADIDHFDAIYYTEDPTVFNYLSRNNAKPFHRHAPLLKAIYLQNEYKKQYGVVLPIFKYSGIHYKLTDIPSTTYSDQSILSMWSEMVKDYLKTLCYSIENIKTLATYSVDEIKIAAMYGAPSNFELKDIVAGLQPGNNNYQETLQLSINEMIKTHKKLLIESLPDDKKIILYAVTDDIEQCEHLFNTKCDPEEMAVIMLSIAQFGSEKIFARFAAYLSGYFNAISETYGLGAMHQAAANGQASILKKFIEQGMNPNRVDNNKKTALFYAIQKNNQSCIETLINCPRVDLDAIDNQGYTPLAYAVIYDNIEAVSLLLQNGATANYLVGTDDQIAIMLLAIASLKANSSIIEQLLNHGLNIHAGYPIATTILLNFIKQRSTLGAEQTRKNLKQYFNGAIPKMLLLTPLQLALLVENRDIALMLLEKGALSIKDKNNTLITQLDAIATDDPLISALIHNTYSPLMALVVENLAAHIDELEKSPCFDQVAENKRLMTAMNNKADATLAIIASTYWERHHKPILLDGKISAYTIFCQPTLLNCILTEKITGYKKDKQGRFKVSAITSCNNDQDDLSGRDFSAFNFSGCILTGYQFQRTRWSIMKEDKITFANCRMDDFAITEDSDLSKVTIIKPIFSNEDFAKKVVNLFHYIPVFILEDRYIDIVKQLLALGKKLLLDDEELYECINTMLKKKQLELFTIILQSIPATKIPDDMLAELYTETRIVPEYKAFHDVLIAYATQKSTAATQPSMLSYFNLFHHSPSNSALTDHNDKKQGNNPSISQ